MLVRAYVLRTPGVPLREESLALHELHGDLVRVRMLASGVCRSDLHAVRRRVDDAAAARAWPRGRRRRRGGGSRGHRCPARRPRGAGLASAVPALPALRQRAALAVQRHPLARARPAKRRYDVHGRRGPRPCLPRPGHLRRVHRGAGIRRDPDRFGRASRGGGTDRLRRRHGSRSGAADRECPRRGERGCAGVRRGRSSGTAWTATRGRSPDRRRRHRRGRLEQARRLGVSHCLRGDDPDLAASVRSITDGRAEHAFEAIGGQSTIELLPSLIGRGGQAVIVGRPAEGTRVSLDPFDLADQGSACWGATMVAPCPSSTFPAWPRSTSTGGCRSTFSLVSAHRLADRALADLRTAAGLRTILEPETA